jgi:hypothetical protein
MKYYLLFVVIVAQFAQLLSDIAMFKYCSINLRKKITFPIYLKSGARVMQIMDFHFYILHTTESIDFLFAESDYMFPAL